MKFAFSKHALEQMERRNIDRTTLENILASPDHVILESEKKIYQSIILLEGKSYLIRIFVNHQKEPNLVITVYKTSKISKYYEG